MPVRCVKPKASKKLKNVWRPIFWPSQIMYGLQELQMPSTSVSVP